jgi:uncharacterized membrane protein
MVSDMDRGMLMNETLQIASKYTALLVNWMALAIVIYAAVEAFIRVLALPFGSASLEHERAIWLRLSRWLVAALTFQLAADIVESAISMNWESIGRLGAVAIIRTFLNYFLARDVREIGERAAESAATKTRPVSSEATG